MSFTSFRPAMVARSIHLSLPALLLLAGGVATSHAQIKQPVKYIQVSIVDKATGKPVSEGGVVQVLQAGVSQPLTQPKINPGTGVVQALLDPATEYTLHIVAPGYFVTNHRYTTPPGEDYEEVPVKVQLEAIPIGKELLSETLFAPGESNLQENAKLNDVVKMMHEQPGITIGIAINPDARSAAPPPPAPAVKTRKQPRKGRRGAPAADTVAAAPPPPPLPTVDLSAIGQSRLTALREFFKKNKIGLDRVSWDVKSGTMLPHTGGTQPANVQIKIAGVQPFELESDE